MESSVRAGTAAWRPAGPKTRLFRYGLGSPATDAPLPEGTIVGDRYRVMGLLGEGGMGRVYDAQALQGPHQGTSVALKILRHEQAGAQDLARFRQEAKATNGVGHPAIVRVLDFAELPDGTVYLAMERLRGQSVEDWLCTPGRLRDALVWLAGFARGLHAAHAAGIVHRDVKPANLFLHADPNDRRAPPMAKILDFGIAKVVRKDATRIETQAGTLLGTPYYLAPERALGRPLDPRADLYSLGVILYEVLTGAVPFEDDNFMGILAQHIKAVPLDPRQAAPERSLPAGVCALAMRLLAKDPQDRPSNGETLAAEIEALLVREGAAIDAVSTGPLVRAAPSLPTMHFEELEQRPTAVPDGAVRGPRGTTRLVISDGSLSAMSAAASSSAAISAVSGVRVSPPDPPSRRWPQVLAGIVIVIGVIAAVGLWRTRASAPSTADAVTPHRAVVPAAVVADPLDVDDRAETKPQAAPTPEPTEPEAEPVAGGSTGDSGSGGEHATPGTTSGVTTSAERSKPPRTPRRPKPKPKADAPPPPDFKDDVYED